MLFASARKAQTRLSQNPYDWTRSHVKSFLDARKPSSKKDQAEVIAIKQQLEENILREHRGNLSLSQILRAEDHALPLQVRVYRELHQAIAPWYYKS